MNQAIVNEKRLVQVPDVGAISQAIEKLQMMGQVDGGLEGITKVPRRKLAASSGNPTLTYHNDQFGLAWKGCDGADYQARILGFVPATGHIVVDQAMYTTPEPNYKRMGF